MTTTPLSTTPGSTTTPPTAPLRHGPRLNSRQRIVIVIGLAAGLFFFGQWATASPGPGPVFFGTAPLSSSSAYSSRLSITLTGGLHPWVRLLIWLGLTVVWVTVSVVLLRPTSTRSAS
jgi:hypothetical protein